MPHVDSRGEEAHGAVRGWGTSRVGRKTVTECVSGGERGSGRSPSTPRVTVSTAPSASTYFPPRFTEAEFRCADRGRAFPGRIVSRRVVPRGQVVSPRGGGRRRAGDLECSAVISSMANSGFIWRRLLVFGRRGDRWQDRMDRPRQAGIEGPPDCRPEQQPRFGEVAPSDSRPSPHRPQGRRVVPAARLSSLGWPRGPCPDRLARNVLHGSSIHLLFG